MTSLRLGDVANDPLIGGGKKEEETAAMLPVRVQVTTHS